MKQEERGTFIFWRQRSPFSPQESFLVSVTTLSLCLAQSKATPPLLLQLLSLCSNLSAGFGNVKNRITHVQPLLLWGAFSIRAFPPSLKLLQQQGGGRQLPDVILPQGTTWYEVRKIRCWMQEASLVKLLLPRAPPTFGWSASLPWQSNTSKSEPQKKICLSTFEHC